MMEFFAHQKAVLKRRYPRLFSKSLHDDPVPVSTPVSGQSQSQSLQSIKKMLKFLDAVPNKYKEGPWSPLAHIALCTYLCLALFTLDRAITSFNNHDLAYTSEHPSWLQTYRLCGGVYGFCTSLLFLTVAGVWPFASYTLTSWNLMTIRLIAAYLAGNNIPGMATLASVVRFPALVGCTVTVVIWWMVLVPIISYCLSLDKSNPHAVQAFWKWNTSAVLLNVHLINLPLIAVDFISSGIPLRFFDFWMAYVVGMVYILFYLNVLDAHGLHFYIILTPRSGYCVLVYSSILAFYYLIYVLWDYALVSVHRTM